MIKDRVKLKATGTGGGSKRDKEKMVGWHDRSVSIERFFGKV